MKYVVDVAGASVPVEILGGGRVRVGDQVVHARLTEVDGTPVALLAIGDAVHRVVLRRGDARGRYALTLGGRTLAVEALDERTRAIRAMAGASAAAAGPAPLVAPMPGLIVRVAVAPGDAVVAGQGLVVMEAMKMENELRAAAAGTVRAVHVAPGTAVNKGAVLVELE